MAVESNVVNFPRRDVIATPQHRTIWDWLIARAYGPERRFDAGGSFVDLPPGSATFTLASLAAETGVPHGVWQRLRVRLENAQWIATATRGRRLIVTVLRPPPAPNATVESLGETGGTLESGADGIRLESGSDSKDPSQESIRVDLDADSIRLESGSDSKDRSQESIREPVESLFDSLTLLPPAPVPADLDLTNLRWLKAPLARWLADDIHGTRDHAAWRAHFLLRWKSWHQVPAGSLPDDDEILSALTGFAWDIEFWRRIRPVALSGFVKCADGRLYHLATCAEAVEALAEQQRYEAKLERDRERRQGKAAAAQGADSRSESNDGNRGVQDRTGQDRTESDSIPPPDGGGMAAPPPPDSAREGRKVDAWHRELAWLGGLLERSPGTFRSFAGRLCAAHGDEAVRAAFGQLMARASPPVDPKAALLDLLQPAKPKKSGGPDADEETEPAGLEDLTRRARGRLERDFPVHSGDGGAAGDGGSPA